MFAFSVYLIPLAYNMQTVAIWPVDSFQSIHYLLTQTHRHAIHLETHSIEYNELQYNRLRLSFLCIFFSCSTETEIHHSHL